MSFILNPLNSVVPIGGVSTLTGTSGGGAVGPSGGNINIAPGAGVTVTGNPATHTITIDVSGAVPETFDADSGSATSALGIVNVFGGPGISTSAAGNTITITATEAAPAYTNVAVGTYNVLTTDYYISVDCSVVPVTLKFANAATLKKSFVVKDRTGSAHTNNITITTVGGVVLFDGSASYVMNSAYESINLIGNGSSYEIY